MLNTRAKLALTLMGVMGLAALVVTGCTTDAEIQSPNLDSSAPAVPDGIDALLADARAVRLSWNANLSDPDLAGYVVYRSQDPNAAFVAVTTTVSSNIWTDESVVPGRGYYYRIAAIDVNRNLSPQSGALHVQLP